MMLNAWEGSRSGAANMERDMDLLDMVRRGDVALAFRTYTWEPWTVSLGKHQQDEQIDREALVSSGFDLVRRPTGGRAVLHAEELTYCIAIPVTDTRTPRAVYAGIHTMLLSALQPFVPGLSFEEAPSDLQHHYATSGALAVSCFTSSARTEIVHGNRKVVGSAQRVIDNVILQHGSILTGPGHLMIGNVVRASADERARLTETLMASSVSLSEASDRIITPEDIAEAIHATASEHLRHI